MLDTTGPAPPHTATRRRPLLTRLRGDDGSTTVEMAVLFPVLLILLMTIVQAGMWWHARNLALAAAQAGVQVARTTTGTAQGAEAAAVSYLARAGGDATTEAAVHATVTAQDARVEVSATAPRVLPVPGLESRVDQIAQARREVFTTPGDPP